MTLPDPEGRDGPAELSIVLVSTNQRHLLEQSLPTLLALRGEATFEVGVVDNACRDGTADWVVRTYPEVRTIRNAVPRSYAANVNQGIRRLRRGRYVAVMNPDVKCLPGLLSESVGFLDRHPDVGLVGPQLLEPDGSVQLSCRRFSTPLTLVLRGLQLDRVVRAASVDRFLMKDVDHGRSLDVDWVFGAMMIARREAVAAVGGMDERYRVTHWEDEDWCCAMWRGGWRVCYVPAARAVHEHQQAGRRRPFGRMGRAKAINAVRMLVKFRGRLSRTAAGAGRPAS